MILLFPDLDTLRLCVTGNVVAPDVVLAPAAASFDDQNRIYVEPSVGLSKTTMKDLDRLGVKGSKRHAADAPEPVASWLQLFPVTRGAAPPVLSSQATVLFELESADDLPVLVTEMLRLGNDRQSFRWFAAPDAPDGRRVLLRVIGPPYYTLLRALDRTASGTAQPVRAYVERAPRVWVEIGHDHPFAAQVRVADQQAVLIRPPRTWTFLDEAPFQDVYDILQFRLPTGPVVWAATEAVEKMVVPLRLTAGGGTDEAELWVLRDDGVAQLDALVRDAEDRLTQRLMFAVAADPAGRPTVVLRTRPSKLPPPVLPLERAVAFRPFSKLPNLFVPAGRRLHPTLRRDAVRRLLADDPDRVVWLYPDGENGFVTESVPDAAFRALDEWVEYVIEAERQPLAAWIGATRFDFDHFVCTDAGGPKPRPDKGDKEPTGDAEPPKATRGLTPQAKPGGKAKVAPRPAAPAEFESAAEARPPSEWKVRREELQKQFLAVDGPLDHPDRRALWPGLAAANTGEGNQSEAALCWLNGLWEADPPPRDWLAGWVRNEFGVAPEAVTAADLDRRLSAAAPSAADYRAVVAHFLWAANQNPVPAWLPPRLTAVRQFLDGHEDALPVRAVWLAGLHLARVTGADVLGLARVRDRLLNRLLTQGLTPEKDLPGFLRFAGLRDAERLQVVRDKALDLHRVVRDWTAHVAADLPYVDLYFAYGLAKLGEATSARKVADDARRVLDRPADEAAGPGVNVGAVAGAFLYHAFEYRIDQALRGKPHAGSLSRELLDRLDALRTLRAAAGSAAPGQRVSAGDQYWSVLSTIDRFRLESRVLEPNELPEPYREVKQYDHPGRTELMLLTDVHDPKRLVDRVRWLYKHGTGAKSPRESQCQVLNQALTVAPRAGEAFCLELLDLVPAAVQPGGFAIGYPPTPAEIATLRGEIVDRAITLAGHFGRTEYVQRLVGQFVDLVQAEPRETVFFLVNAAANQCVRQLKKYGMRDEIDRFLTRVEEGVTQGRGVAELRGATASKPDVWLRLLRTLTHLAGGWLSVGQARRAGPFLDAARAELYAGASRARFPLVYTDLAMSYLAALGHGNSDSGLADIRAFFTHAETAKLPNNWTGSQTYSRLHLKIVEEAVLALVSDEFALGPAGRRWLDDDEYLVRRRVHADMKGHLERSGL